MTATTRTPELGATVIFPFGRTAAVGIGSFWAVIAVAETLLGNGQDALDSVSMLTAEHAQIAAAGLLHFVAGILLVVGLAGVAPLIWPSRLGRVGWALSGVLAAAFGAFSMVHLLALQATTAGLDAVAMDEFLVKGLGSGGPWVVPMLFVGLLGSWIVALLVVGLVRVGVIGWLPVVVVIAGSVLHLLGISELTESLSHWVIAGALVVVGYRLWRASEG